MRPLALLVALLAADARAQDFVRTTVKGHPELPLFWTHRCLVYRIGSQGSAATPERTEDTAIEAAVASWQRAADSCGNGWQFVRGEPVPVADYHLGPVKGSGPEAQILFRDVSCDDVVPDGDPCLADPDKAHVRCANAYQCMFGDPSIIGLTTVTHRTDTGEIIDVDVELDAAPWYRDHAPARLFTAVDGPPCTGTETEPGTCVAFDIQNTLTHELGHAVGLDHVPNPASTMFLSADPGEVSKRVIDDGTRKGFCTVYPPSDTTEMCLATTQSGLGPEPVTGGCASAPALLPLAAAALAFRGRRRERAPRPSRRETPAAA